MYKFHAEKNQYVTNFTKKSEFNNLHEQKSVSRGEKQYTSLTKRKISIQQVSQTSALNNYREQNQFHEVKK